MSETRRIINHSNNSHSSRQSMIENIIKTRRIQLTSLICTLKQIGEIQGENNSQLKDLKTQIITALSNKIVRTSTNTLVYSLLTADNKNFLKDQQLTQRLENIKSEHIQKQIERQKMCEFKEWIKNPEMFESYFSIKLTKQSLKDILNPKYDLLRMVYFIESFLQQNELKSKGYHFKMALIQSSENIQKFIAKLQKLIKIKKMKVIEQKVRVLELLSYNIQNESEIKSINEYMKSYIKLYKSINSPQSYTRFITEQQTMKYFNFTIDQTTVVLRNPQLMQQKSYQPISFQSEFAFINDGEYVFNNEYRSDFLCFDEIIDLERSINTMIGSEYLMEQETEDSYEFQGKMVEINSYLRSDKKIFLRLRLNSAEFDKITIKILKNNSSTWQSFIKDQKQSFLQFTLQIVPDQGENRHIYGFTSSKLQKSQESFKINQSIFSQEQQTHLVLEDDVISLYLSSDQKQFICWNETRENLIFKSLIEKPVINLIENFPFQHQLYLGIVFYSTVSEIEIFDHK